MLSTIVPSLVLLSAVAVDGGGTAAPAVAAENTESPAQEPVSYKEEVFQEGDWSGFRFYTPVFASTKGGADAAIAHYGLENIVGMLNAQISSRLRSKVKNGLPKNLKGVELDKYKAEKLRSNVGGVLLSKEQALAWKPDAREESSTSVFKEIKDAIKAGNILKVNEIFPRLIEALSREGGGETIDLAAVIASATK